MSSFLPSFPATEPFCLDKRESNSPVATNICKFNSKLFGLFVGLVLTLLDGSNQGP